MIYVILRWVISFFMKSGYKRIDYINHDYLIKDKATIILSNHPSGFLEPVLYGTFLKIPLYFLVRGDLFANPIAGWVLRTTNQIPIFRFKDGFKNLRANKKSFDEITSVLGNNKPIMIFAEGSTKQCRQVRKLQKGPIRILLDFMDAYPDKDISLIPAGISFVNPNAFGAQVTMRFHTPISRVEIEELRNEHSSDQMFTRALLALCADGVKESIWELENEEKESLFNDLLLHISLSDDKLPVYSNERKALFEEGKRIADKINNLSEYETIQLRETTKKLTEIKKEIGVSTWFVDRRIGLFSQLINWFIIVLFVPFYIPIYLAKLITKKVVFQKEFYTSIYMSSIVVFMSLWVILLTFLLANAYGGIAAFIPILMLTIMGVFAMRAKRQLNDVVDHLKFKLTDKKKKEAYSSKLEVLNRF